MKNPHIAPLAIIAVLWFVATVITYLAIAQHNECQEVRKEHKELKSK